MGSLESVIFLNHQVPPWCWLNVSHEFIYFGFKFHIIGVITPKIAHIQNDAYRQLERLCQRPTRHWKARNVYFYFERGYFKT